LWTPRRYPVVQGITHGHGLQQAYRIRVVLKLKDTCELVVLFWNCRIQWTYQKGLAWTTGYCAFALLSEFNLRLIASILSSRVFYQTTTASQQAQSAVTPRSCFRLLGGDSWALEGQLQTFSPRAVISLHKMSHTDIYSFSLSQ
jgi:hypothetical protein